MLGRPIYAVSLYGNVRIAKPVLITRDVGNLSERLEPNHGKLTPSVWVKSCARGLASLSHHQNQRSQRPLTPTLFSG